ncbi:MAG: hypothetical protein GMKNLPBB_03138 [Myxococcota bacterium]|nr:hypothetical protein [Myxococcota bacterium]
MKSSSGGMIVVFLSISVWTAAARAQTCPKAELRVDNDIAGSGYSEEKPENWESRDVGACHKTYRYLSQYIGDRTRKGKAIWKPKVTVSGWYAIRSGWRATENRASSVAYLVYDDLGNTRKTTIDQRGDGCKYVELGEHFCKAGGQCRVVLDGNNGQSAAADMTIFTLTRCEGQPPADAGAPDSGAGACDGIRKIASHEVCGETANSCQGVFAKGEGCEKYCAAAGMVCTARFGGEPGCQKEPRNPIPCGASNGHLSDWCECQHVGPPDAGPADISPPDNAPPDSGSADTGPAEPPPQQPGALRRVGGVLQFCGAPVRLVGYGDYGLLAEEAFDFNPFLDQLRTKRLNLVRVWIPYQFAASLAPFAGAKGSWDLRRINEGLIQRLRSFVAAAAQRNIVVQVTVFDSVGLEGDDKSGNRWINSFYRPGNHISPWPRNKEEFNRFPGRDDPPVWKEIHQPYIARAVSAICDQPNVIYEIMNEPDGSGAEPGIGVRGFVDAAAAEIRASFRQPQCTGSRVISANDHTMRAMDVDEVDVISMHLGPSMPVSRIPDFLALGKPVIISNDGDDTQTSTKYGFGALSNADRARRIAGFAAAAFDRKYETGHAHLEILDKDINGASWKSQNYEPRHANTTMEILDALGPFSITPPASCGAPPEVPDAGLPDEDGPDGGKPDEETPDGGAEPDSQAPDAGDGICRSDQECAEDQFCNIDLGVCVLRDTDSGGPPPPPEGDAFVDDVPAADSDGAPPAGGCIKDTDCKGSRICIEGVCTDPAASQQRPAARTDAGAAAISGQTAGGGCGCDLQPRRGDPGAWWWLAAAAALVIRRRWPPRPRARR